MTTKFQTQSFTVPYELAGMRLDQALARLLPQHSRSRLKEWIEAGRVSLGSRKPRPRDLLSGGGGNDNLRGGADNDLLIGSPTAHDNDPAALAAILALWTSDQRSRPRATITAAGGSAAGLTLDRLSILDDGAVDQLWGERGLDLFFLRAADQAKDRGTGELLFVSK